jgi:hypothetical protein
MTMPHQAKGPSLAFIGLGLIILVAGIGIFVALIVSGIQGLGKDMIEMAAPGEQKIELTKPGAYTIFHEYRNVTGNRVTGSGDLTGLTVTVKGPDGANIAVSPVTSNQTYNFSGRSGRGLFEFHIATPGTYTLTAGYDEGQEGSQAMLTVLHDFMGRLLITIFSSLGVLFGSILIFVIILVLTLIGRAKARQKAIANPEPFNPIGPQG